MKGVPGGTLVYVYINEDSMGVLSACSVVCDLHGSLGGWLARCGYWYGLSGICYTE